MADHNATATGTDADEPFALSDAVGGVDRPPAERGTLYVKSKAVGRIAERASAEVDGTVKDANGLQQTFGRGYPRANVHLDGRRAQVDLDVAVIWPAPVATIAESVRDHVIERTVELSGLDVTRVDVTVHVVDPGDQAAPTRRVQ